MASDPRLMALPALRKLADTMANDWHALAYDMGKGAAKYYDPERVAAVFLAQLSDLTIAASRDAVARLVAEAVGLECGATAPGLHRSSAGGRSHWQIGYFPWSTNIWVVGEAADWNCGQRVIIPGISAVTDPAEALTLIALAVLS